MGAWVEIFPTITYVPQCAGMFNGGLPGASLRFDEYLKTNGMEAGKELDELKEQQWKLSR